MVVTEPLSSERELEALAVALGAGGVPCRVEAGGVRPRREARVRLADALVDHTRAEILRGEDPLGQALCTLRSPEVRRSQGATYTPDAIVRSMLAWAGAQKREPGRVVDPGAGSGRFLIEAARRFPKARLIGVELDPLATTLLRANLAVHGLAHRSEVVVGDYRAVRLPAAAAPTLFIGNPPYVRHHLLGEQWKRWLTETARRRGLPASQLAGLHVHFFLATVEQAQQGDFGALITAAEWLDVNYGKLLRSLFLDGLGGSSLALVAPQAMPFPDATTTAAITCFEVGARKTRIRIKQVDRVEDLGRLDGGAVLDRTRLEGAPRWTPLLRRQRATRAGYVELGELCRVHRGQVTGNNGFWIAGPHAKALPRKVLVPVVTRALELYRAGRALDDVGPLERVIDLPADLGELTASKRRIVEAFLERARAAGIPEGYIASHRKPWWSVRLREPAPILATYMARRPPGFVRNLCGARHINIAHGIYPREPMTVQALDRLRDHLAANTSTGDGRTYAGGLTKFEPKEMERLLVPGPELLCAP